MLRFYVGRTSLMINNQFRDSKRTRARRGWGGRGGGGAESGVRHVHLAAVDHKT